MTFTDNCPPVPADPTTLLSRLAGRQNVDQHAAHRRAVRRTSQSRRPDAVNCEPLEVYPLSRKGYNLQPLCLRLGPSVPAAECRLKKEPGAEIA